MTIEETAASRAHVHGVVHRPILFSGPMVRAILEGRKTQTRREVKLDNAYHYCGRHEIIEWRQQDDKWFGLYEWNTVASLSCPYGRIGDRLWVRETARATATEEGIDCIHYMADDNCRSIMVSEYGPWRKMRSYGGGHGRAVPSIHMPRWASRITLEITGLRIERVNAITPDDAKAEGVECCEHFQKAKRGHPLNAHWVGFAWLWKSINGEQSWLSNPWVWVVEFKVV